MPTLKPVGNDVTLIGNVGAAHASAEEGVDLVFKPRSANTTFVRFTNTGFSGDGDEVVKQTLDSTEGFALVPAGAKAFLEPNITLNLIADRYPDGH